MIRSIPREAAYAVYMGTIVKVRRDNYCDEDDNKYIQNNKYMKQTNFSNLQQNSKGGEQA